MSSIAATEPTTRTPGPSGRGGEREQAICAAVMELLTETSYDAVTIDAVAARAKASKATIYRRWSGRDELVLDVIRREFLHSGEPPADTGSLRGDLLAALSRDLCPGGMSADQVSQHKMAAIRSLSTALTSAPDLVSRVVAELTAVQVAMWQELLSRALERGEIASPVSADLCARLLRGQLFAQAVFGPFDASAAGQSCTGAEITAEGIAALEQLVDDILLPVVRHAGTVGSVGTDRTVGAMSSHEGDGRTMW